MAKSAHPPPFTYAISTPHSATFFWDGSHGVATYFWQSETINRGLDFLKRVSIPQQGVVYNYWAFGEMDDNGNVTDQSKRWLFEAMPRPNETNCTVYYYYLGQDAIFYGMAQMTSSDLDPGDFRGGLV